MELDSHALKLAQVSRTKSGIRIAAAAVLARPRSSADAGGVSWTSEEIRTVLAMDGRFRGTQVACALRMRETDLHTLPLPPASTKEHRAMIAQELESIFAGQHAARVFDFWEAASGGDAGRPGNDHVHVLSVARATVDDTVAALSAARLQGRVLDGLPCTLARAVELAAPAGPAPAAAIQWGMADATFCVVASGQVLFARHLRNCGLGRLVEAVVQTMSVTEQDAVDLLATYGLPGESPVEGVAREVQDVIAEITAPALRETLDEITRTIAYLRTAGPGMQPSQVYLLGEGAAVRNIAGHVQRVVKLPAVLWHLPEPAEGAAHPATCPQQLLGAAVALSALAWTS